MNRAQRRAARRRRKPKLTIERVPCERIPAFYELIKSSWGEKQ